MTTPKNKTLVELVIPDVHNRFESVYTRAALVAKGVDRVYFVGDMRNQIDFRKIQESVGPKEKALFELGPHALQQFRLLGTTVHTSMDLARFARSFGTDSRSPATLQIAPRGLFKGCYLRLVATMAGLYALSRAKWWPCRSLQGYTGA